MQSSDCIISQEGRGGEGEGVAVFPTILNPIPLSAQVMVKLQIKLETISLILTDVPHDAVDHE